MDNSDVSRLLYIRKKIGANYMNNIDPTGKKMDSTGKNRVSIGKNHLVFLPESAKHSTVTGKK